MKRAPTKTVADPDASVYLGLPKGTITWDEVDRQLREGNCLEALTYEMGLSERAPLTVERVKNAIAKYLLIHGTFPYAI